MLPLKTNTFRKNLYHCRRMLQESIKKEKEASTHQNYVEVDKEGLNQQLIQKLAFLELCGWLETTLDDIYLSIGKTRIERDLIERHIRTCYGFDKRNFTSCLKFCIGNTKYEKIKNSYEVSSQNKQQKTNFLNKLDELSGIRNEYAHTSYKKGVLQGGQPGINGIKKDFIFLLKILVKLYYDLQTI